MLSVGGTGNRWRMEGDCNEGSIMRHVQMASKLIEVHRRVWSWRIHISAGEVMMCDTPLQN